MLQSNPYFGTILATLSKAPKNRVVTQKRLPKLATGFCLANFPHALGLGHQRAQVWASRARTPLWAVPANALCVGHGQPALEPRCHCVGKEGGPRPGFARSRAKGERGRLAKAAAKLRRKRSAARAHSRGNRLFNHNFAKEKTQILGGRCFLPLAARSCPMPMAHRVTPVQPEVTPGTKSYWHTGTTPWLVWQTKYKKCVRAIANHIFNTISFCDKPWLTVAILAYTHWQQNSCLPSNWEK